MALRNFRPTTNARAQWDPVFRKALSTEAVDACLGGDEATGKTILKDIITASTGLEELAAEVRRPPGSL